MRKMHFAMRANALAVFPGGFGTFDELFEVLTLLQTRKAPPVAVVLFGLVDEPEEGWAWLLAHGLRAHTPADEAMAEEG